MKEFEEVVDGNVSHYVRPVDHEEDGVVAVSPIPNFEEIALYFCCLVKLQKPIPKIHLPPIKITIPQNENDTTNSKRKMTKIPPLKITKKPKIKLTLSIKPPKPEQDKFFDKRSNYEILERIGEGGFGKIDKAKDATTNQIVVLKQISKFNQHFKVDYLRREIKFHEKLS